MRLKTRKVKSGDTLGRRLIEARERGNLSRERLQRKHMLSFSFVTALEQGDYEKIPEYMYSKAQLKKYLKILKLDEKENITLFQEEYVHWKNLSCKKVSLKKRAQISKPISTFELAPSFWQKSIVVIAGFLFLAYIGIQVDAAIAPTNLALTSPEDRTTIEERSILVEGSTDTEAVVTINDQEVHVENDGYFSKQINLQTGLNILEITATKKYKPENTLKRHIIVTE